jgi:hypothetical protein
MKPEDIPWAAQRPQRRCLFLKERCKCKVYLKHEVYLENYFLKVSRNKKVVLAPHIENLMRIFRKAVCVTIDCLDIIWIAYTSKPCPNIPHSPVLSLDVWHQDPPHLDENPVLCLPCVCVCVCVCERERERERDRQTDRQKKVLLGIEFRDPAC